MQNQYGRDALYGRTFVYMYASFIYTRARIYIYCILYSSKHELPYYCWACEDIHTHTIHSSGVLLVYSNRVQLNVKNDVSISTYELWRAEAICEISRQHRVFLINISLFCAYMVCCLQGYYCNFTCFWSPICFNCEANTAVELCSNIWR